MHDDDCVMPSKLPDEHFTLIAYMTRFFNEVSRHQGNNKMGAPQLAIVVAPNILRVKVRTA